MPVEDQAAGQGPFIRAELRPPLGPMEEQAPPLEPGASREELRQRAMAALHETELSQLSVSEESLAPGLWEAVFVRSPEVNSTVLDQEAVLLNLESGVYYTLNPVGTAIWEQLTGEQTLTEILSAICTRYGVSADTARRDLAALATRLRREGLIEERR